MQIEVLIWVILEHMPAQDGTHVGMLWHKIRLSASPGSCPLIPLLCFEHPCCSLHWICVSVQVHTQSRRMLELHAPIAIVDTGDAAWTVLYANPAWLLAAGEQAGLSQTLTKLHLLADRADRAHGRSCDQVKPQHAQHPHYQRQDRL